MMTTTPHTTSHYLGRTAANAYHHFNRFEAKTAGRFAFTGSLMVRAGFWTIRIAVALALALAFLIFILPLLPVFWLAKRMAETPWTEEDEKRLQDGFYEKECREREEHLREVIENDFRKAIYPDGQLPRWDM